MRHEDVVEAFAKLDFEGLLTEILDAAIEPKIAELQKIPLVGGFLTEERVASLRGGIVNSVLKHRETLLEKLEEAVEKGLDVQTVVTEKISGFPVEKLESLVLAVAARELRAIELLGAALVVLIGIAQVLLIWGLS